MSICAISGKPISSSQASASPVSGRNINECPERSIFDLSTFFMQAGTDVTGTDGVKIGQDVTDRQGNVWRDTVNGTGWVYRTGGVNGMPYLDTNEDGSNLYLQTSVPIDQVASNGATEWTHFILCNQPVDHGAWSADRFVVDGNGSTYHIEGIYFNHMMYVIPTPAEILHSSLRTLASGLLVKSSTLINTYSNNVPVNVDDPVALNLGTVSPNVYFVGDNTNVGNLHWYAWGWWPFAFNSAQRKELQDWVAREYGI